MSAIKKPSAGSLGDKISDMLPGPKPFHKTPTTIALGNLSIHLNIFLFYTRFSTDIKHEQKLNLDTGVKGREELHDEAADEIDRSIFFVSYIFFFIFSSYRFFDCL